MYHRIKKFIPGFKKNKIDAFIVYSPANISYLTEYRSRDSVLLVAPGKTFYITDGRYSEEARTCLPGITIKKISNSFPETIAGICSSEKCRSVGFESAHLSFAGYQRLVDLMPAGVELVPFSGLIEVLRQVKEKPEIALMRHSVDSAVQAFEFVKSYIIPGKKEIEIAAEIERFIRFQGASCASFDIIVASGPNSSLPHHMTSERVIREDEPVLIDMGVEFQGYKSDLTRVFFSSKINFFMQKVYTAVLNAQKAAIKKIKPGVPLKEIDFAARDYIESLGWGKNFVHGSGHGIGLDVHELPSISAKSGQVCVP
ncbi:MAG: Xaa-Pro peptidase family protein, partial [Candidatus Omnitrophica bacterium]|nr:Xaa-Pro peptidase family protein [Candidatus Omnitrophota bacterium]